MRSALSAPQDLSATRRQGVNMSLSVYPRKTGSQTVLVISGDLDAASSGGLQESLLRAARLYPSPLLLDLSGVDITDRAGLQALITIRRLIEARDGGLRIIGVPRAPTGW
jgi:anti-anti-sigma factor